MKERLELHGRAWASTRQILYPNGIGFASNHIFAIEDEAQRTAVLQTYNDFLVDLQEESGDRLLPQAMLPIWDMDLTIKEMTRLLDEGHARASPSPTSPSCSACPSSTSPTSSRCGTSSTSRARSRTSTSASGARKEEMEAHTRRPRSEVRKAQYAAGRAAPDPADAASVLARRSVRSAASRCWRRRCT